MEATLTLPAIEAIASGATGAGLDTTDNATGSLTLPKLVVTAFMDSAGVIYADLALPMLVVQATTQRIELPSLLVSGEILTGNVTKGSQATHVLPSLAGTGSLVGGRSYAANFDLPSLTAEGATLAVGEYAGEAELPCLETSGAIFGGAALKQSSLLPKLVVTGTAYGDGLLAGTLVLPAPTLSVSTLAGGGLSMATLLPRLALAASGYTGSVTTASLTLPMLTLDGEVYGEHTLEATITIPMLQLVATMADTDTSAVTVFAMNAKNAALTNYDGLSFNSAVRFNGVDLVANESGIFAITGDLDDGVIIDAYATLAATNFGTMQHKRVQSVHLGYRADGEMRLKVTVDEHHEYEYQVQPRNYDDIHGNRVKLGKGAKGTYWGVEVGNVDGSGFELDNVQIEVQPLSRKVY